MKYKVRIIKIGASGAMNELNYIGKIIKDKFIINTGKFWWQWWKKIELNVLPDEKEIDEDHRVYYAETKPNVFVQLKKEMNISPEQLKDFSSFDSDVFVGTISAVIKVRNMLQPDSLWKKLLPYVGLMLTVVLIIVLYAMLMNKGGG